MSEVILYIVVGLVFGVIVFVLLASTALLLWAMLPPLMKEGIIREAEESIEEKEKAPS